MILLLILLLDSTNAVIPGEEPDCNTDIPMYMNHPHTYYRHVEPSDEMKILMDQVFPKIDDIWYKDTWQARVDAKDKVMTFVQRQGVVMPRGDEIGWRKRPTELPIFTADTRKKFLKGGMAYVNKIQLIAEDMHRRGPIVKPGTAPYLHQMNTTFTGKEATRQSKIGFMMDQATLLMAESLDKGSIKDTQLILEEEICEETGDTPTAIKCDPDSPYRNYNGSCNNLKKPRGGMSFTPFRRLFPHDYSDGVSKPRLSKNGSPLPNPRKISLALKKFPREWDSCFNVFQMSFGQFIDHDLTATPTVKGIGNTPISCCHEDVLRDPSLLHPECLPIYIHPSDPFYQAYGVVCLDFVRSLPASRCNYGPREQINQLTSAIDGSAVYGSTKDQVYDLRKFKDGLLTTNRTEGGFELLPITLEDTENCNTEANNNKGEFCFKSGDERVNEHLLLTLLTTLFAREHNRVATELKKLRPEWDDEKLYQEARRIVVAEIQHITFNEFLPGLFGTAIMDEMELKPNQNGKFYEGYDDRLTTAISNEFATAALRMGHSMIPEHFYERDTSDSKYSITELNNVIFHPYHMYNTSGIAFVLYGALSQSIGKVGPAFSNQITGKLFKMSSTHGFDLVAMNIMRGRDHGLATYTEARRLCGYGAINNFDDLNEVFDKEVVDMLKEVYDHVGDIDLFVGGMCERPLPGGLVGPTFGCILIDQFVRSKKGDRFWYENKGQSGSFTEDQLRSLHRVSLGRVICDNFKEIAKVQRWPLQLEGAYNPGIHCTSQCFPSLDLTPWQK